MSYQKTSEIELVEFAKRLNELCDDAGMPEKYSGRQVELAKLIRLITNEDISTKAVRKWLEGAGFPSTDKIILIAKWANVSSEWLISGRGRKTIIDYDNLSPKIDVVVKLMQEMTEYQKEQAVRLIDAIAEPAPNGNPKSA